MTTAQMLLLLLHMSVARDSWVNPETFGANALPTPRAEQPWTLPDTQIEIGGSYQYGRRFDHSFAPTFRLALPFGRYVTAYFEGMPFELWWSSSQTLFEWSLPRAQGISKADISFGAKFMFFDGSSRGAPSVALRVMTKTTSGKDYDARRFTDAPGYLIDVLGGERWQLAQDWLLSAYANVGTYIWQQGADGQNDAINAAAAVSLAWLKHGSVAMETRGYAGWQSGDKTVVQSLRVSVDAVSWLSVAVTGNLGLLAAPRAEARLDFIFRAPALLPWVME